MQHAKRSPAPRRTPPRAAAAAAAVAAAAAAAGPSVLWVHLTYNTTAYIAN